MGAYKRRGVSDVRCLVWHLQHMYCAWKNLPSIGYLYKHHRVSAHVRKALTDRRASCVRPSAGNSRTIDAVAGQHVAGIITGGSFEIL